MVLSDCFVVDQNCFSTKIYRGSNILLLYNREGLMKNLLYIVLI